MPWTDCSAGTNELIGEDLPVIISLECQPVNGIRSVELHGDLMLYLPEFCSEHALGNCLLSCSERGL